MSAQQYIERCRDRIEADEATIALVVRQWAQAVNYMADDRPVATTKTGFESARITCGCGRTAAIEIMFRCFYCGIWFCPKCAREHFGEEREHGT